MNIIFSEHEIERIKVSAQALHHFLHYSASRCSSPLHDALRSLRAVGRLDQILRHGSPPEKSTSTIGDRHEIASDSTYEIKRSSRLKQQTGAAGKSGTS